MYIHAVGGCFYKLNLIELIQDAIRLIIKLMSYNDLCIKKSININIHNLKHHYTTICVYTNYVVSEYRDLI